MNQHEERNEGSDASCYHTVVILFGHQYVNHVVEANWLRDTYYLVHIAAEEAVKGINNRKVEAYIRALILNQSKRGVYIDLAFTVKQVNEEVACTAEEKDADVYLEVNAFLPKGPRADLLHLIIIHSYKQK